MLFDNFLFLEINSKSSFNFSDKSFYKFVYHDGVLEGLDDRIKIRYIKLVKELCEKFSISEYHLKEGFKELYNSTIYGYLLDKKLEFALHRLEENKLKVKDIAFEIGYENPSHFISAFKKKYSLTPKQYTKQFK